MHAREARDGAASKMPASVKGCIWLHLHMAASMDVHTREAQHRAVYSKQIFSILLHSKTCVYSIACAKPNHYLLWVSLLCFSGQIFVSQIKPGCGCAASGVLPGEPTCVDNAHLQARKMKTSMPRA